jgi:hypothetical protein
VHLNIGFATNIRGCKVDSFWDHKHPDNIIDCHVWQCKTLFHCKRDCWDLGFPKLARKISSDPNNNHRNHHSIILSYPSRNKESNVKCLSQRSRSNQLSCFATDSDETDSRDRRSEDTDDKELSSVVAIPGTIKALEPVEFKLSPAASELEKARF